MGTISLAIFVVAYIGIAIGRIPGLMLDRTGIALLGAIAMTVTGVISVDEGVKAIDIPTLLLLYALMVISAQLRLGGFYTWVAIRITSFLNRPRFFLFTSMLLNAFLSALLANDIICLAFTPVLTISVLNAGLNPIPFLLGLAISSNIGSAATIIGNPQNMLIGQVGDLHFDAFLNWCTPPSVVALIGSFLIIYRLYQGAFFFSGAASQPAESPVWPQFDWWQSMKGVTATVLVLILFFSDVPRELSALTIAGFLLCSRKLKSRHILELIDWNLIVLFCALFVIIEGIAIHAIPSMIMDLLSRQGVDLGNTFVLAGVSGVLSNLVSNVPATMLLVRFLEHGDLVPWYTLAISSTFAGNLVVIGSIANLIVIEQARSYGVTITFKEHARVGIPVTVYSFLCLFLWISL